MSNLFKSNSDISEGISSQLQAQGMEIGLENAEGEATTNLTAIGNLNNVIEHLNTANSAYKDLLSKDASAISFVKETYDELDNRLSECLGVE